MTLVEGMEAYKILSARSSGLYQKEKYYKKNVNDQPVLCGEISQYFVGRSASVVWGDPAVLCGAFNCPLPECVWGGTTQYR